MTSDEIWRPVVGFEDYYEVSDRGRVRSFDRFLWNRCGLYLLKSRILKPSYSGYTRKGEPCRYLAVNLSGENAIKRRREIQVIVLEAFRGSRPKYMQARHLNGNPADNRLVNLEYGTPKQNAADMIVHGTLESGSKRWNAKLKEEDIPAIRAACKTGVTRRALSRRYGVATSTIQMIHKGRNWKHV